MLSKSSMSRLRRPQCCRYACTAAFCCTRRLLACDTCVSRAAVLQDKRNMCFSSTNVVAGDAIVVVATTGLETEFGKIAKSLADSEALTSAHARTHAHIHVQEETTPLQEKLDEFGTQLGWVHKRAHTHAHTRAHTRVSTHR